jgi:hypothetical protein
MTTAVSRAIQYAFENYEIKDLPALDIGTGTAYHTLLMLALEHPEIIAADINPQAIEYAKERIENFFPDAVLRKNTSVNELDHSKEGDNSVVNLLVSSLQEICKNKNEKYALATFNPPILYPFVNPKFDKPASHGVYFEMDDVKDHKQDLVYQYYQHIAQNNLAKGSHIFCVWTSLNRHLVETEPFNGEDGPFVHPAEILKNWFGFEFENEAESLEDFYQHTTVLGAGFFNQSETGDIYTQNLEYGMENNLYSKMLIPSEGDEMAGTHFKHGILHLVKTSDTENKFEIVNGSSSK